MKNQVNRPKKAIALLVFALGILFLYGCSDKTSYQPVKESSSRPVIDLSDETAVDRT